jgi:hypothetical protein
MFGRASPRRPRDGSGFPARICQKPNPLKPPARGFGVRSDEFADWPGANCNDPLRADEMRKLDFPFEDRADSTGRTRSISRTSNQTSCLPRAQSSTVRLLRQLPEAREWDHPTPVAPRWRKTRATIGPIMAVPGPKELRNETIRCWADEDLSHGPVVIHAIGALLLGIHPGGFAMRQLTPFVPGPCRQSSQNTPIGVFARRQECRPYSQIT